MTLTLAVILTILFAVQARAACGPDAAPAPAAAHGLTCEVFHEDFTSSSTVDLTNSGAPGFNWYLRHADPTISTLPGDISFVAGGMQILRSNITSDELFNMSSCVGTTIPVSGPFYGNSFQGDMYVDIKVSSIGPAAGFGDIALWMLGVQQLYGGYTPPIESPEIDFTEDIHERHIHEWHITSGGQTNTDNVYAMTPTFANDSVYGVLVLTPASNGGVGTMVGYLNDVVEAVSTPPTWSPGGTFSSTGTVPMCFLISSGWHQALVLRSYQVFQAPPPVSATGAGRPRRGLH